MDDLEPNFSDLETENPPSKLPLIAIGIGIVGMIIGITGVIIANNASNTAQSLQKQIDDHPDRTPEIEAKMADIEERLVKLGSELVKLGRQDRQIRDDTQGAFDSVSKEIKENRTQINEIVGKFEEALAKLEKPTVTRTQNKNSTSSTPAQGAEDGVHYIESGDTLSGIASKYGVSLSALMSANPSVNPRTLQIGQAIKIP